MSSAPSNVQHLESLNDLVERLTGVVVRETIPDSFLRQADQVVNLDLAVEDLQERLRAGKIYPTDRIPWALEHFFKEQNLGPLRELALREVAESVERATVARPIADRSPGAQTSTRSRVMVCVSSGSPRTPHLVRRGSRMAGRLNSEWFVVFVETPDERLTRSIPRTQRHLFANIEKAKETGGRDDSPQEPRSGAGHLGFRGLAQRGAHYRGSIYAAMVEATSGRSIPLRLVRQGRASIFTSSRSRTR